MWFFCINTLLFRWNLVKFGTNCRNMSFPHHSYFLNEIFFSFLEIYYYFAENQQTSWLIVKKYELLLLLIFFKCDFFLHKYAIILQDFFITKWRFFWSKWVKFSAKFEFETLNFCLVLWNWKLAHMWNREIYVLMQ